MRSTKKNPNFTSAIGLKAVPSKIGQLIGHDFSPAVYNDEKMRAANLAYYVGDRRTILMVAPNLKSILDQLPNGKILFFHCKEGSLTKDEICDFFNKVCPLVPFKISPDELYELGTIPYSRGVDNGHNHTYYGYELEKVEPSSSGEEKKSVDLTTAVPEQFDKIKDGEEGLKTADATAKMAKKEDLEKYFRRNRDALNKLDDQSQYLVVFIHGDEMDEDGMSNLANDINKKVGGGMKNGDYSAEDIVSLGTIRKKFPGSGEFEDYDVFATKVG